MNLLEWAAGVAAGAGVVAGTYGIIELVMRRRDRIWHRGNAARFEAEILESRHKE